MKIIISPAKKINDKNDFSYQNNPINIHPKAHKIYEYLKALSIDDLSKVLKCSNSITKVCYNNLKHFNLEDGFLTAIFAYDGIQYKTMNPSLLDDKALMYLNENLLILSAIYGASHALDLIIPHRLEMQAKTNDFNLYDYWGSDIASNFIKNDELVINLASSEYSKAITTYISKENIINISFKEGDGDKLIEKGVYVKQARGAMVRYMAVNQIINIDDIKKFNELGYEYSISHSNSNHIIFIRRK